MLAKIEQDKLLFLKFCSQNQIDVLYHPLFAELQAQMDAWFAGQLKTFDLPIKFLGTDFQKSVWQSLALIPYAATLSYQEQAAMIQRPTAYRAVANAIASNPLHIILPCHRVIQHNGGLGGYQAGQDKKRYLLDLELKNTSTLFVFLE